MIPAVGIAAVSGFERNLLILTDGVWAPEKAIPVKIHEL